MRNIPVITFLQRTWMLLAFTVLTNYLSLWKHIFLWVDSGTKDEWGNVIWNGLTLADILGAIIYLPGLASAVWFFALLLIHLHYRETIDKDAHNGGYARDWANCTAFQRVAISNAVRIGFFIGLCLLGLGLAK